MCSTDYDRPELYNSVTRKARKTHQCYECRRAIAAGESYEASWGIFEGMSFESKTCSHCRVGQNWLAKNCGGFLHEGLFEEVDEHANDYQDIRFGMLRLKIGMQRKWKRFDGAGLMPLPPMPKDIHIDHH